MKYPTKEQIENKIKEFKNEETIEITKKWKKTIYKKTKNRTDELIKLISMIDKNVKIEKSNIYCYNRTNKKIYIDKNNPSIISTLHEYRHHTKGSSELEACAWSIWIFKECFPLSFKRLKWSGHMLKKNE